MQEPTFDSCISKHQKTRNSSKNSARQSLENSKPTRLVFKFAQQSYDNQQNELLVKPSYIKQIYEGKFGKTRRVRVQTPSIDIKINILTEKTPKKESTTFETQNELTTLDPAFLTAIACENLSFTSASSGSHLNTPSASNSNNGSKKAKREIGKPARFKSQVECEEIIKSKKTRSVIKRTKKQDSIKKIIQKDQIHLKEELLFRKYRKHKYIKLLPFKFDDSWEWSSYGSISPQNKPRLSRRWLE